MFPLLLYFYPAIEKNLVINYNYYKIEIYRQGGSRCSDIIS